jgi:exodeoxyribonuclease V beta subunit
MTAVFDPVGPLAPGWLALEASAGTGKTWSIAAVATRLVAEEGVPLDQLLLVTFTRAATAELRDRVRRRLVTTRTHLAAVRAGQPPPDEDDPVATALADVDDDERSRRLARLDAAVRDFDAATITTIHGFCQRVLAAAGFVGDIDGDAALVEEVDALLQAAVHDLLVTQWADAPADDHGHRPKPNLGMTATKAVLARPRAAVRPDRTASPLDGGIALARLARAAADRVAAQTRSAATLTFDDLLHRLDDALGHPHAGPMITDAMRRAFTVGMVDEFQDTDPMQWAILSRLFAGQRLIVIGDPKQAIYRFRGADVAAYLDATTAPGTEAATLIRNRRSDPRLVAAVNRLFDGTAFGDDRIAFAPVEAHATTARLRMPAGDVPPLQVRVICHDPGAEVARHRIAEDLAAELTALLASGSEIVDKRTGRWRELQAGDCAVLVRTNVEADQVKAALGAVGVHAVVNGVGSVLDSDAADDWQLLLDALDQPSSGARVRALALSPVVGMRPDELAALDEPADAALHERVTGWARVLADHGVATLVRTVIASEDVYGRLLGQVGGDRWVADFLHLGELLHAASAGESTSAAGLRSWLDVQAQQTEELPADQRARRLESDAGAVQIMTIHRAKGLEFPVVLCPYLSSAGMAPRVPLVFADEVDGTVIDLGSQGEKEAKLAVRAADQAEHLRLLYVALTRAANRLVVWWWPVQAGKAYRNVALSKVLCCPPGDGWRVTGDGPAPLMADGGAVRAALNGTRVRVGADVEIVEVPDEPVPVAVEALHPSATALAVRPFEGRIDRTWTRSSFTALTRPLPATATRGVAVPREPDEVPLVSDEVDVPPVVEVPSTAEALHLPLPLGGQPGGPRFGTLVHAILEHVDLAAPDLGVALSVETHRRGRTTGVSVPDPDGLAAGLVTACRTPLGPAFGDMTLAGVPRADRLDELTFELPLAHGGSTVTLAAIASVVEAHLPDDDPFAGYAATLRDRSLARSVRGYLTGSIDLVLRRHVDGQPVFSVIDHKTNTLHGWDVEASTRHYGGGAMVEAMRHSHYVLQALLYQVVLHRFLRWRQPGYDARSHLGPIGYTFLRGMAGPSTPLSAGGSRPLTEPARPPGRIGQLPDRGLTEPAHPAGEIGRAPDRGLTERARPAGGIGQPGEVRCGVLAWQPPVELVAALSDLLDEGRP